MRMPLARSIMGAASECTLQAVVFGEALQGDVDRALQLFGGCVDDVGEDASFRGLVDVGGIACREQCDHGAGGLADDLADQLEGVLEGEAESDERDVGLFLRGDRADFSDVDLAGDHLVTETCDGLGEQLEPVASLVGDQDPEVLDPILGHRPIVRAGGRRHVEGTLARYGGLTS